MGLTKVNHPDLLDLASDTGATVFPKGATEERPVSPEAGYIRFNTTDNVMEAYDGTEWLTLNTLEPLSLTVDYLVVAGGGGSLYYAGGGGGGLRTSYGSVSGGGCSSENSITTSLGETYTILVGSGGASGGYRGGSSSFSGQGVGTITSIGGGGTGHETSGPREEDGGSGAGWSSNWTDGTQNGGSGTPCQGFDGGTSTSDYGTDGGSGGGGAGSLGGNRNGNISGGNGGNGLEVAITGSSAFYSGGGYGGVAGGSFGTPGLGQSNYGGGANSDASSGLSGNSGVVILRMKTAIYTGTTTGSPTVTTDGSDTILTYTTSGTYTA